MDYTAEQQHTLRPWRLKNSSLPQFVYEFPERLNVPLERLQPLLESWVAPGNPIYARFTQAITAPSCRALVPELACFINGAGIAPQRLPSLILANLVCEYTAQSSQVPEFAGVIGTGELWKEVGMPAGVIFQTKDFWRAVEGIHIPAIYV